MRLPNLGLPLNAITRGLESIIHAIYMATNKDPYRLIEIESIVDEYTIIARDESFLTVFEFNGVKTMMDDLDARGQTNARQAFYDKIHLLNESTLSKILEKSGTKFEIFFHYDPDGGAREIAPFVNRQTKTTKALGVNLEDVAQSQMEHLPKFIHSEKCYIGVWTNSSVLNKNEREEILSQRKSIYKEEAPYAFNIGYRKGQNPYIGIEELLTYHNSNIEMIEKEFLEAGFSLHKIPARKAVALVRKVLNPLETAQDLEIDKDTNEMYSWEPISFGDKVKPCQNSTYFGSDVGTTLPVAHYKDMIMPSLASQILVNDLEDFNQFRYVKVGDMAFAPVTMTYGPQYTEPFNILFKRLAEAGIPYFFKQTILSNGIALIGSKPTFANALLFLSGNNKLITNSYKQIIGVRDAGEVTVRMCMQFVTYAPFNELKKLQSQHSQLMQFISSWGNCSVSDISGSASVALLDSLPFISQKTRAMPMYPNTFDAFVMSPLFRPAPIFNNPTVLTRSVDGKLLGFETMSPRQTTWGIFTIGIPGSGKSNLINTIIKGAMLKAGATDLPFVSILDIGPSSKALADIFRNALPENQKHLVQAHKITPDASYAVNLFDLPLMLDEPDPEQLEAMTEIILEMIEQQNDKDFKSLTTALIKRAYLMKSNRMQGTPTVYRPNNNAELDRLIATYNLPVNSSTTWYQVRDMFFNLHIQEINNQNKSPEEKIPFDYYASMAQRYAVPTMQDLSQALEHGSIKDQFNMNAADGTGSNIREKFRRLLGDANVNYPNLFRTTRLDLTGARVISIDLDTVAKGNAQTNLYYMFFMFILLRDFRLSVELVKTYPENCRWYHIARAETLFAREKFIVFDEYHRPAKASKAMASGKIHTAVDRYNREGRKWGMSTILSTQELDDIDPELIRAFSTAIFMSGQASVAKQVKEKIGIGDAEYKALMKYCKGANKNGAPLLAVCKTDDGESTQVMYSTTSPVEVWALSTTKEDVLIRTQVTEYLGMVEARARLARAYGFSAKHEVKALQNAIDKLNQGQAPIDPIAYIVKKIIDSPPVYESRVGGIHEAEAEVRAIQREREIENMKRTQLKLSQEMDERQRKMLQESFDKALAEAQEQKEADNAAALETDLPIDIDLNKE